MLNDTFADSQNVLLDTVLDLTACLPSRERYTRLLASLSRVVGNDACALLRCRGDVLVPIASQGLKAEVMGQQFRPDEHPRLAAALASRKPVRFSADDPRPDPFDGLLLNDSRGRLRVHSCIGCTLYSEDDLFGVLTVDSLAPGAFDGIEDRVFAIFASIAAVAMRYETFIDALEALANHRGLVARELVREALLRGGSMLGESPAMQNLCREIDIVAPSDLTVLVTGETGVGKEVVARTIHARSRRADQPLVHVNCAALPETLAESELFGHVRGAFSGANTDRSGKFELADGGTLFLDEIGELPLSVQAKLLRALQFGEIQRLGSDKNHRADVRVIAATNRQLAEEVKAGRFRADLYHRLSIYPLHIPPLRERIEDIPLLAGHFLDQARVRLGLVRAQLASSAVEALKRYSWPGNVRELEHVILRAALRASSRGSSVMLQVEDLAIGGVSASKRAFEDEPNDSKPRTLAEAVADLQRQEIRAALDRSSHNWSEAARRLGLDRSNLYRLAKRLGIR
ncbi:nitric oxide reductase transcriptional regulator NorR [Methylocaldum szegediense]|uniref:Regulatory protein LuxO n=1 Tax=Methylocaldum szegediense TaxID=73780 RepID=A0ABN8X0M9_9GAMM|nr:nitric oxide reductase transcriptional regulator NorR [Methylocaldum szegediense]CAI8799687.1 Regulatory protein LuxO [Methylocaldum szegediense]